MFGTFRFVLAHMVMLGHLWRGLALWVGPYAVFSFFALSGYLMALVLDRRYGFTARGLRGYATNRVLRIYPPYLAVLCLAVPLIAAQPDLARSISTMRLPDDPWLWLRNLGIVGLHFDKVYSSRLVPPIWSVDIELCFYAAMGLGLARGRRVVTLWFLASAAWTVWAVASDLPFPERYSRLVAASLPYSAGALLYHWREPLSRRLAWRGHVPLSLGLFGANAAWCLPIPINPFVGGLYLSLASSLYAIASLDRLRPGRAPGRWARIDARLGDLSYPVFLVHWSAALIVLGLGVANGPGPWLFVAALPVANGLAWAVHAGVERPVESWRARVRRRAVGAGGGDPG